MTCQPHEQPVALRGAEAWFLGIYADVDPFSFAAAASSCCITAPWFHASQPSVIRPFEKRSHV
jgi:hypothetical protein